MVMHSHSTTDDPRNRPAPTPPRSTPPAHPHSHAHGHAHCHAGAGHRGLWIALALNAGYMMVECGVGLWSGSLVLLADAGHWLTDVAAIGLALLAIRFACKRPDPRCTYGYYRAETLAALFNGATLILISGFIFYEAIHRLQYPHPVEGRWVLGVAILGLVVNAASAWVLRGGDPDDLNMRGVFLHLIADCLASVATIGAGALIYFRHWDLADPIVSLVIGLMILYGCWGLMVQTIQVLMQGTPPGVDLEGIERAIAQTEGVRDVHDLHVWTLGPDAVVMTAHVVLADGLDARQGHACLECLNAMLQDRFGLRHTTIQLEYQDLRHGEPTF